MPPEQIEQIVTAPLSLGEWALLLFCSALSAITALGVACRDRQYRDRAHLLAIGAVGGLVGLGSVCFVAHMYGGVIVNQLLLLFVAPVTGLLGRQIEIPLTKKIGSVLGVEVPEEMLDDPAED
jgi:CHASE2 domain-containing sensor protein